MWKQDACKSSFLGFVCEYLHISRPGDETRRK